MIARPAWLLAALALPAAASAQVAPVYKEIGDWIAACDNSRACVAKAVPDTFGETGDQTGYLRIERDAGPAGRLKVWIGADDAFVPKLSLDGKPVAAAWRAGRPEDDEGFILEGDAALSFLRAVRNGQSLTLAAGKDAPTVSLKGLTAVLLALDEAQERVGNVTALARPGPAPAAAAPPPAALPVLRAAPAPPPLTGAKALIAAVRRGQAAVLKRHDCDDGEQERLADDAQPLNRDEAVVLIGCITGAYQGSQLAFRVPRAAPAKAQLLALPPPPVLPADEQDDGFYTEAGYDPDAASFMTAAKGRGLADCGVSIAWVYDGTAFKLSDLDYQGRCGGGAPGDWPTLYRTRTAPARP